MKPIVLDSTLKKLQVYMGGAPATTQPSYVASFAEIQTALTDTGLDGSLNGVTSVDVVPAPASGVRRVVSELVIFNSDTADVTCTLVLNNNGTIRPIKTFTILPGKSWALTDASNTDGVDGKETAFVRLSLVSGDPNPKTDQAAKNAVIAMPYNGGNTIPRWNGTRFVGQEFSEMTLTLYYSGGVGHVSGSNYGVYLWLDGSTLRIVSGVAWASATSRGTGAGTAEIEIVNGVPVNKYSMTVRNGATTYTMPARYGTMIGDFCASANGVTDSTKVFRGLCNWFNTLPTVVFTCPGFNANGVSTYYSVASTFAKANGGVGSDVKFILSNPTSVCLSGFTLSKSSGYMSSLIALDSLTAYDSMGWCFGNWITFSYAYSNGGNPVDVGLHTASMVHRSGESAPEVYADYYYGVGQPEVATTYMRGEILM